MRDEIRSFLKNINKGKAKEALNNLKTIVDKKQEQRKADASKTLGG